MVTITAGNRFSINDICSRFKVSAPWIRKLETMGLLEVSEGEERVRGKRRDYTEEDLMAINFIFVLRDLGLELSEIKRIKDDERQRYDSFRKIKSSKKSQPDKDIAGFLFYPPISISLKDLPEEERKKYLELLKEQQALLKRIWGSIHWKIKLEKDTQDSVANMDKDISVAISELERKE